VTAILGLNYLDGVLMLADTEESLGTESKSECDKLHRFIFRVKGAPPKAATVITGGAGDTHLIECANQQMELFLRNAISPRANILSVLSTFAQKFFQDTMEDYQGLSREITPQFPDMLIAMSIPPNSWLFRWQGNQVFSVPGFTHSSIGLGIAQLNPMLRDVQFSSNMEAMLFHGVRMMFHAKRAVVGVGGQTEAMSRDRSKI
jgi:hypothetical protein